MRANIPQFKINEILHTQPVTNIVDVKIASLLPANTGYCNYPIVVSDKDDLINKFDYETTYNYKYWWNIFNALEYDIGDGIYVVRPINLTDVNYGLQLTETTTHDITTKTNIYNPELAQSLLYDYNLTSYSMEIFNRYVTNKSDIAIAICGKEDSWNETISNEEINIIRNKEVSNYETITTTYNNKYIITTNKTNIEKLVNQGVNIRNIVVNGNKTYINPADYIKIDTNLYTVSDVDYNGYRDESITNVQFTINFTSGSVEPTLYDILAGDTSTSQCRYFSSNVTSGSWGGSDAAGTMVVDGVTDDITNENMSNLTTPSSNIFTTSGFTFPESVGLKIGGNHEYLNTTETIKVDSISYIISNITYNTANDYTLIYVPVSAYNTIIAGNTILIESDTTIILTASDITDTLPQNLEYLYQNWNNVDYSLGGSTGTVLENMTDYDLCSWNTTTAKWELTTIVANTDYYIQNLLSVYNYNFTTNVFTNLNLNAVEIDQNTATKLIYTGEMYNINNTLKTFNDVLSNEPNWLDNEFGLLVFKKNDNQYTLVESYVLNYTTVSENTIYNQSEYIYLAVNKSVTSGNLVDTNTYSVSDLTIVVDENIEYSNITYYSQESLNNTIDIYLDSNVYNIEYLLGFQSEIETAIYEMNKMSKLSEYRQNCVSIIGLWDENDYLGLTQSAIITKQLNDFGNNTSNYQAIFNKYGSYSSVFGNMKLQYNSYQEKYVWLPIIGDIAGLFVENKNSISTVGYDLPIKNTVKLLFNTIDTQLLNLNQAIIFDSITAVSDLNSIVRELHKRQQSNKIKIFIRDNFFSYLLKLASNSKLSTIKNKMDVYFDGLVTREVITSDYKIDYNLSGSSLTVDINITFTDILRKLTFNINIFESSVDIAEV